jgi:hypothetical protein
MQGAAPMSSDPAAVRRQILDCERALYRAQIAGDVNAIGPMLGANLVYIHSTGVAETKAQYLAGVADALYEYGVIDSRDTRLRIFGDAAVMNGVVDMTVSAHGAVKELIHLLFCLVWIREGVIWRLDFRQATRIPGETIRI